MITVTERPSFQGDLMVRRIASPPEGVALNPASAIGKHLILAHSETGHHHVVLERAATLLIDETNAFIAYLNVSEPCEIEHLRSFDTHAPLHLDPGLGTKYGDSGSIPLKAGDGPQIKSRSVRVRGLEQGDCRVRIRVRVTGLG